MNLSDIFCISDLNEFEKFALKVFEYQYNNNKVYKEFCDILKKNPSKVNTIRHIPFMPIAFFKTQKILCTKDYKLIFESSSTTGTEISKHYVHSKNLYIKSFVSSFNYFYQNYKDFVWLALLPSYLERKNSSLIFMIDYFIKNSNHKESGFYLYNHENLFYKIIECIEKHKKVILFGVSFALIDFAEKFTIPEYEEIIVMETGGMKGRRKELTKMELHEILTKAFSVKQIHSEYGMTELLSQAYSKGNGLFYTPPWMRVFVRDANEPTEIDVIDKSGGINIIDLANYYSCSFIATDDIGIKHNNESFEILGRIDYSVDRGCNLLYPY